MDDLLYSCDEREEVNVEELMLPGPDSNTGQRREGVDGRQASLDWQGLAGVQRASRGAAEED
ncbi:hypothetical protein [Nocardia thailandica]|uniref:hypothetical protein n=1 Tax=Nocardia thailandica TaxID=257275 RepID=UPI0005BAE16E|nr:hypothetical protein [Nocardia thailandica]